MSKKAIFEYDEQTGDIRDANGVFIANCFGAQPFQPDDQGSKADDLIKLKKQGFSGDEIVELARLGAIGEAVAS